MDVLRANLLKLVFGHKIKLRIPAKHEVFEGGDLFRNIISVKLYRDCSLRLPYRNFTALFYSDKISTYTDSSTRGLGYIMPPKGKRSGATKASSGDGKRKNKGPAVRNEGKSSDENETEELKAPSRQSKRNVNKVVTYRDEDLSEDDVPPEGGGKTSKKAKYDEDSDISDDSEDRSGGDFKAKAKNQSGSKKKSRSQDSEDVQDSDDSLSEEESKSKKSKKKKDKPPPAKKPRADKPLLNKTQSDYESLDFSSDKTTSDGKPWNLKIASWNVGGLKAWVKKNGVDYIKHENPDVFCLQETKCSESKLPPEVKVDGYHTYWLSGEKEGYAGVGLYTKKEPIKVTYGLGNKEFDTEGRVITAEYENFYLVAAYVPNAGRGLVTLPKRMKWDPDLRNYVKELDAKKPVILSGDMNVSHQPIDLANPKTNTKNAGFTQEERDGMTALLEEGFVDSFRHLYPEKTGAYTFWTYMGNARSRNTGWRLDYFILSQKLIPNLCDSVIRSEVYGSDHCPITLLINI